MAILTPCLIILVARDQWPFLAGELSRGQPIGRDAFILWTAARLFLEGRTTEIYDPAAFTSAQESLLGAEIDALALFFYPPSGLLIVSPLGFLPYPAAAFVWILVSHAAFVIAISAPRFELRRLLFSALAPMALLNLAAGQTGVLCAALLIGGLRLTKTHPVVAGALIGLLSFKPILGVLIPIILLARGQWQTFVSATLVTLGLALLPALVLGFDIWARFLTDAVEAQRLVMHHASGLGVWMIPSAFNGARILGLGLESSYVVHLAFVLMTLALLAFHLHKTKGSTTIDVHDILIISVATALVSPYVHNYDLGIIEGALILVAFSPGYVAKVASKWSAWALRSLWSVGLFSMGLNALGFPFGSLLLLFGLAVWVLIESPRRIVDPDDKHEPLPLGLRS